MRLNAPTCGKKLSMKKFSLAVVADSLLAALCAFIIIFTLVRYYANAAAGLAAGIAAGAVTGAGTYLLKMRMRKKRQAHTVFRAGAAKLAAHLAVSAPEEARKLFAECFENCKLDGEYALTNGKIYLCDFKLEPVRADSLLPLLRLQTEEKKCLACGAATSECAALAESFGIEIVSAEAIYSMLESRGKLPESYLCEQKGRTRFIAKVRSRFTRRLCLPAFWSGAALMFFSYFTYYPWYYIAFGTALLILCAAAAVFGGRKSQS